MKQKHYFWGKSNSQFTPIFIWLLSFVLISFFFYTITAKVIIAVTPKALIAFKILSFTFTNCYQTVTYIRVIYFERNLKKKAYKKFAFLRYGAPPPSLINYLLLRSFIICDNAWKGLFFLVTFQCRKNKNKRRKSGGNQQKSINLIEL